MFFQRIATDATLSAGSTRHTLKFDGECHMGSTVGLGVRIQGWREGRKGLRTLRPPRSHAVGYGVGDGRDLVSSFKPSTPAALYLLNSLNIHPCNPSPLAALCPLQPIHLYSLYCNIHPLQPFTPCNPLSFTHCNTLPPTAVAGALPGFPRGEGGPS